MDTTNSLTHSPSGHATQHGSPDPVERAAHPSLSRVRLVRGAGITGETDLDEQLRIRLRFIAVVAAVAAGSGLVIFLAGFWRDLVSAKGFTIQRHSLLDYVVLAAIETWAAARLVFAKKLRGRELRWIELLVFLPLLYFFVEDDVIVATTRPALVGKHWATVANAGALPYVVLIVSYAVLIPSTWVRCVAGVAVIGAGGFIGEVLGLTLAPQPLSIAVLLLAQKTLWILIGCAVVVYGAYRIEVLRSEAERYRELGQYRLGEALGAGGMGEVYRAEHRLLRRPCAIKLIRPEHAGNPQNLARFEREVQATATLTHPNVVQVFDYGRADDGTFYYAMEYLPGVTLQQLVDHHGPLPAARAIHFLRQICGALGEAHAIGLIHRDIKPGNIMVCARGRIHDVAKLLDFGLVVPRVDSQQQSARITQEGSIAGTPAYMSPEQAEGRADVDCRSDIYSVGALAYFAVTGHSLFPGRSPMKTIAAHLYEVPEPLSNLRPNIPVDLQDIIHRCLAKRPDQRYESAESLETALASCCTVGEWTTAEAAAWWGSLSEGLPASSQLAT